MPARPWLPALLAIAVPIAAEAEPFTIAPTPEDAQSVRAGAELSKRAQELARQKKFTEALPLLEELAQKYPASEHDCLASLGYLRTGDLTRAQLLWDRATLRNGARPEWCTGSLPKELAAALRQQDYAPLTLNIAPPEAVVEVDALRLSGMHVVWLPQGLHTVKASAPGLPSAETQAAVVAPSAAVTLTLAKPTEPPPVSPPRAETQTPPQPPAAPVLLDPLPAPSYPAVVAEPSTNAAKALRWPGYAAVGVGGAAAVTGGVFHVLASMKRSEANDRFVGTPSFDTASSEFRTRRNLAAGGYALATVAVSGGIAWLLTHPAEPAK